MKPILLLSLIMPLTLHAQAPRIRDATTHDDLVPKHRQAQQANAAQKLPEAKGPALSTVKPIPSLISRSDILTFNGMTTLVPKRAILNQPAALATRVNNYQQGSQIGRWPEFYEKNRAWITTIEVTRAQVEGNEPIDEKIVEKYRKSTNLVVATFKGSPVSVMPLREPEKTESKQANTIQSIPKP